MSIDAGITACRKPSKTQEADSKLRDAIEQIVQEFAGYGYRRVTHALSACGMERQSQASVADHARRRLAVSAQATLCSYDGFASPLSGLPGSGEGMQVEDPDTVWVADLTYIRLPSTFAYLACVLDAYSRKCVGWKLSKRIDAQLAVDALDMALATREVSPGLIHHSDRGVQYASTAYVQRLESIGARVSMSAVGNPYDNAKAESFFKTLKTEEVYLKQYQSFAEAEANIEQFLEEVYNTKRLHSSLGYVPPVEFETAYIQGRRC